MKAPKGAQQAFWWRPTRRASSCRSTSGPKAGSACASTSARPDWDEMAEMIAESYCLTAPKRLAAQVGPPTRPERRLKPTRRSRAPISVRGSRPVSVASMFSL